jgi:hypothetical protein
MSAFVTTAFAVALSLAPAHAETKGIGNPPPPDAQAHILGRVKTFLKDGEESFARGDFDHARTAFDNAIDVFLSSGYDLRSDPTLQASYRETVERVNRYTQLALTAEGDTVWPTQAYEATADDFRVEEAPIPGDVVAATGDFDDAAFMTRIGELQRRFQTKFGRSFTVTGRDTSAHSRLYGSGRAVDVRVRDLSTEQVRFVVEHARAMRIRVLDFSTPDAVYRHNMRTIELGRGIDTMATGVHLHLNDLPRQTAKYEARPASKTRIKGSK